MSSYWADRSKWEPDLPGYVFLARAVLLVGARMVPEWDGEEGKTEVTWPLKGTVVPAGRSEKIRVLSHLKRLPDVQRDKLEREVDRASISFAEFNSAKEYFEEEYNRTVPPSQRLCTAKWIVIEACRGGILNTAYKESNSGELRTLPVSAWAARDEQLSARFDHCLVRPDELFSLAFAGDGFMPVYIEDKSLKSFLTGNPINDIQTTDDNSPPEGYTLFPPPASLSSDKQQRIERAARAVFGKFLPDLPNTKIAKMINDFQVDHAPDEKTKRLLKKSPLATPKTVGRWRNPERTSGTRRTTGTDK